MEPSSLSPSARQIIATLDSVGDADLAGDRAAQLAVVDAARRMLARIQTPFERVFRFQVQAGIAAACQILLDLGLWRGWAEAGGGDASLRQLLGYCRPMAPEPNLLGRFLRYLSSEYVIDEVDGNLYRPTAFSLALGQPEIAQAMLSHDHHWRDSCRNMPSFLAKNCYREPLDPAASNYADWTPEKLTLFARMQTNPAYAASFTGLMAGMVGYKADWTDAYHTQALVEGFRRRRTRGTEGEGAAAAEEVLLVDVGGAHGLDVSRLLAKHPELPAGSLVLQDLADVTAIARVDEKIRVMAHDFFDEQPVKGSRAYFLHAVLHDWSDGDCQRILKNISAAMEPGYSRLLVYDVVMPETGASMYQAAADIALMFLVSAGERTEARWRSLLESAGLRVVKIWFSPVSKQEAIIEAELL